MTGTMAHIHPMKPITSSRGAIVEGISFILFTLALVVALRPLLIDVTTTLTHDNIYWGYPAFHYFAESLLNGYFPWWNPYSHGGEPFYPVIWHSRLMEPITLLTIYLGRFFTTDLVALFNWSRFAIQWFMAAGTYLVLRRYCQFIVGRIVLIPILLFSSFMLCSFRQDAFWMQFVWIPYALFFLLRLIDGDTRWRNWLGLAVCSGINFQSYWFSGIAVFLVCFLVGLALFAREYLTPLFARRNLPRLLCSMALIAILVLPDLALMKEQSKYVFPSRANSTHSPDNAPRGMAELEEGDPTQMQMAESVSLSYDSLSFSGTFSKAVDFLNLILPGALMTARFEKAPWLVPSEAFIYFGGLVWLIGLVGIALGEEKLKKVWLTCLIAMGVLMLGPPGGLHHALFYVFPPLWYLRHLHSLVLIFDLCFLYFVALGINFLGTTSEKPLENSWTWKDFVMGASSATVVALTWSLVIRLTFPLVEYLWAWLLVAAGLLWLLRRQLNRHHLFAGLVIGQLAAFLFSRPASFQYLLYLYWAIAVPALAWFACRSFPKARPFLWAFFTLSLGFDLFLNFSLCRPLFEQAHLGKSLGVDTHVRAISPPQNREAAESYPAAAFPSQAPRDLAVIYRKPFAFSALYGEPLTNRAGEQFDQAVKAHRWNSHLLLKNYFTLIHSGIPTYELKNIFAIGSPYFQFKGQVISKSRDIASVSIDSNPSQAPAKFNYLISAYQPSDVSVDIETDQAGSLYWADGYDTNWKAELDKKETEISQTNVNFKSITVQPGKHRVRFNYFPSSFAYSLLVFAIVSFTTLLMIIGAELADLIRPFHGRLRT
jgi:hypothetical protein